MKKEMNENEIFEEMKNEFLNGNEGKEIWEMGKEKITPLLKKWAKAKLIFLVEDETQKDIALEIIKAVEASISDTVDALKVELSNYFLEKVTNFLRAIISKHLLPIFLKII